MAVGGYSIVYLGEWQPTSDAHIVHLVAVKELRLPEVHDLAANLKRTKRQLHREARVWSCLSHPHIVPFLGFSFGPTDEPSITGSSISLWYIHGNITSYLSNHKDADRLLLCNDIVSGLTYLHSLNPIIVHGDMKGANVFVDLNHRAAICDFGLSIILDDLPTGFSRSVVGGTPRYLAPELLDEESRKMTEGDVYACACLCAEVLCNTQPYAKYLKEAPLYKAIAAGELPFDIQFYLHIPMTWRMLFQRCWSISPQSRPTMIQFSTILGSTAP